MSRPPAIFWTGAVLLLGAATGAAAQPNEHAENMIPVDAVTRWRPYARAASQRFGIPLDWIERVMRAESGGRTHLNGRPITSRAGALGLMQLMPATWSEMRARLGLGFDPHDPRDNILAGACYLRLMYDRFGYPGLFGAYHAGPARYAARLADGRPLPAETRAYLAQLGGGLSPHSLSRTAPPRATLFVIERGDPGSRGAPPGTPAGLFVRLSTPLAVRSEPQ